MTARALVPVLASALLTGCASILSGSAVPDCIGATVVLPVLSTAGAVIVPVEIDGVRAAAEITPRSSATYLTSTDGLHVPRYDGVGIGGLIGSTTGYRTRLHTLRLGSAEIDGLYVTVHDEIARPSIDGRQIMMTIGSDLLRNDDVLMDLPARRVTLSGGSSCPAPPVRLDDPAVSTSLREGDYGQIDVVDAFLDGQPVSMEINLSSNDTLISQSTVNALGIPALDNEPAIRTGSIKGHLGRRHRFESLRIAGYRALRPNIDVLPAISYNVLGLDFFQNKVALFDFSGRRLEFKETGTAAISHASLFSGVITRQADTTVSESASAP